MTLDPTTIGLYMFFAYPPLILAYDMYLKFVARRQTISSRVWSDPVLVWAACAHMCIWAIGLGLHFGFKLFGGGATLSDFFR